MDLSFLIYHSRALLPAKPEFHNSILAASLSNNERLGVTGFLHREDQNFVQYLEGDRAALDELVSLIRSDPRHTDFTVVAEGQLPVRQLPEWQMGFVDGEQLSLVDLVGVEGGQMQIKVADPKELVEFVVSNADRLCGEVISA